MAAMMDGERKPGAPGLTGKVAVVTGGTKGIGRGIVERLCAEGVRVVAGSRGAPGEALPEGAEWVRVDVSARAEVAALHRFIAERYGRLDILVNNAGMQVEKTVVETTDEDWEQVMGANALGVFLCCRALIPLLREGGGGAIVNIGSISGFHADPSMALYNASKGFVHGLTRSIAVDHGAEGIRCNAVCPGWILTGMADQAFAQARDPEAAKRDALARHAVGRLGQPSDIAAAVAWLVSDDAAFVTGQTFVVDGGLIAASPVNPSLF